MQIETFKELNINNNGVEILSTIGIRVTPNMVYYSIINQEDSQFDILKVSKLIIPVALDIPGQLAFIRTSLISIITEYKISKAGLRVAEGTARINNSAIFRINLEGVIQEVFSNSTIEKYACCNIAVISGILKEDRKKIKNYMNKKETFADLDGWSKYKKEECETIVVATACALL